MTLIKPYYEKTFERHKQDLEDVKSGKKKNLRFNKKLGLAYVSIIEQLKHYKGEFAGQKIKLEDWQKKLVAILFGWQKLNSKCEWVRRFNTAFIFIPRKNGKTILASGIAIADAILSGEYGGEIVIFATKREQAKLCWVGCEKMIESHPDLKKESKIAYSTILIKPTDTTIKPLGRDSKTEDGLSVSLGIADEYHAHPDNSLWEVIESSQGARKQPLMIAITTAGFYIESPAYAMYEYAKKVLDGVIEDDNFFAFIAEADKDDDPFSEETWIKANPNYDVSFNKDYMQKQALSAKNRPELRNNFLVKHLNIWTTSAEEFISFAEWKACKGEIAEDGRKVAGIDLSVTDDFSSLVVTIYKDGKYYIKPKFYIPEDGVKEREKELRVPLFMWVKEGFVIATPGNSINYDYILADIEKELSEFEALCYDPYRAKIIINRLENEFGYEDSIPIRQGYLTLSSPTGFLRSLIREKKLVHNDNPVMNWMISNVAIKRDEAGNIKPDKSNPRKKIDGVAALINTLAYFEIEAENNASSVYETRGIRSL